MFKISLIVQKLSEIAQIQLDFQKLNENFPKST